MKVILKEKKFSTPACQYSPSILSTSREFLTSCIAVMVSLFIFVNVKVKNSNQHFSTQRSLITRSLSKKK